MQEKDLDNIKKKLQEEKERLENELNILQENYEVDILEVRSDDQIAASLSDREAEAGMVRNLQKSLKLVNKAIEKISQGEYGLCETCGKEIDPARLRFFPSASLCLKCSRLQNNK